ncbi:MAG: hypothetical protein GX045_00340 [Clostridiaceae bacterium]|jgi:hypothetical protein|nr:hypothetical protein [Clostridiaceae bacterium]
MLFIKRIWKKDIKPNITLYLSLGYLIFTGSSFNFVGHAQNEAFYDIKGLIPQYLPKTSKIIPQGAWDAVTINGHIKIYRTIFCRPIV